MSNTMDKPLSDKTKHGHDLAILAQSKETKARSIAKIVSYRILGSTATALIVDGLVNYNAYVNHIHLSTKQNFGYGLSGFFIDMGAKLVIQYAVERLWTHVDWGYTDSTNGRFNIREMLRNGMENAKRYLRSYTPDKNQT